MNWMDYQKRLGLNFDDNRKSLRFFAQIHNFILEANDTGFDRVTEQAFCNMIGETIEKENNVLDFVHSELYGLQRAWIYLERRKSYFVDFLSCFVALINSYPKRQKSIKKALKDVLLNALDDCQILYEIFNDDDGIFIFPKGAKELDDALVSQPLTWLKAYPIAYKTYCVALRQYSDGIYIRDVADNLRKALEDFLREFFENEKDLNSNKKIAEKYLKDANANPQLVNMFASLLTHYYLLNNDIAKHNNKVDKTYLEFLLYQTGVFIRMLIVVKKEQEAHTYAD